MNLTGLNSAHRDFNGARQLEYENDVGLELSFFQYDVNEDLSMALLKKSTAVDCNGKYVVARHTRELTVTLLENNNKQANVIEELKKKLTKSEQTTANLSKDNANLQIKVHEIEQTCDEIRGSLYYTTRMRKALVESREKSKNEGRLLPTRRKEVVGRTGTIHRANIMIVYISIFLKMKTNNLIGCKYCVMSMEH